VKKSQLSLLLVHVGLMHWVIQKDYLVFDRIDTSSIWCHFILNKKLVSHLLEKHQF
jgi:hypothetical protein